MRLYVALTYLDRREWAEGTMWAVASGAFELFLRSCLRNEANDTVAAHVALYFTGASDSMISKNLLFERKKYTSVDRSSFFVDILNAEPARISYVSDRDSWYNRWVYGRKIELYEVLNVNDDQIKSAHGAVLSLLSENRPYDWTANLNSLFPECELPIGCLCCCCQCWAWTDCRCVLLRGITCVSGVLVGLAATRGAGERRAAEAVGLKPRAVLGGWLPADVIDELVEANVLRGMPVLLDAQPAKPLEMLRR